MVFLPHTLYIIYNEKHIELKKFIDLIIILFSFISIQMSHIKFSDLQSNTDLFKQFMSAVCFRFKLHYKFEQKLSQASPKNIPF